jgi:hypothetical protein
MRTLLAMIAAGALIAPAACREATSASLPVGAVTGSGTPGRVAMWDSATALRNAPIKVDSLGNIIMQATSAIYLVADTICFKISKAGLQPMRASSCPGL